MVRRTDCCVERSGQMAGFVAVYNFAVTQTRWEYDQRIVVMREVSHADNGGGEV